MRHTLLLVFAALFLLGGCHGKQIRHLASDAALEAHGLTALGEKREVTPAVSRAILEAAL